jgi:hypothetical protein
MQIPTNVVNMAEWKWKRAQRQATEKIYAAMRIYWLVYRPPTQEPKQ